MTAPSTPEPTCVECGRAADPRQRCVDCREPVCARCATYDDDGVLHCPECLEDAS